VPRDLAEAETEGAPTDTTGSAAEVEENQTNGQGHVTQQPEQRTRQQSATPQSLEIYLQKRFPYRALAPAISIMQELCTLLESSV
jgi:hypothetical protein